MNQPDHRIASWRRWGLPVLILTALALAFSGILDRLGEDYTSSGFKRALATFAVARALNGVISVAQETEVVVHPAGVGLTLAPGQILDPINDLVERFSWVMLASSTSLGIQAVLLEIVRWHGFGIAIALLSIAWAVTYWRSLRQGNAALANLLTRILLIALALRLAVPLMALTGEALYQGFLQPRYEVSLTALQSTADSVESLNLELAEGDNIAERARQLLSSARDAMNWSERLQHFKDVAANASESAINLIVVFVLQTVLLPLLFFWLLLRLTRLLWSWPGHMR